MLKGLSFKVESGQTCGIVGRTGSGKSSLLLALFHLIDVEGGCIMLDGVDTSRVALDCLRKQVCTPRPLLLVEVLRYSCDPAARVAPQRSVSNTVTTGAQQSRDRS